MNFRIINVPEKHYKKLRFLFVLFSTIGFFYAFYFVDKEFSLKTILENIADKRMYFALLFSFLISLWPNFLIGKKSKSP